MSARYDCADTQQREDGLVAAATAVQEGQVVVLPTDTVYGIGADAFSPSAVAALLAAKGRGRNMPPPVLVGSVRAASALTQSLGAYGQDLIDEFWPGPLTLVFRASPTLRWDLGDTQGTVAVRMPLHPIALDLLRRTGPMAVSSANLHGAPAATTADEAAQQLGDAVSVYLDGGPCADSVPSTILDLTGTMPRLLRAGVIGIDALRKVVPVIDLPAPAPGRGRGAEPGRPPGGQQRSPLPRNAADAGQAEPTSDQPSRPGTGRLTARRHARVSLHPDHRGGGDVSPHPAGAAVRDRHQRAARAAQPGCAYRADAVARRARHVRRAGGRAAGGRPA